MKNEKREYRISMDSLTAIVVMQSLDVIVSLSVDENENAMMVDVVRQIDNEHTRFLNDPIRMESTMPEEKKTIDIAIEQIQHDRLVTGLAFQIIEQSKRNGIDERVLVLEVVQRIDEMNRETMERELPKE